MALSDHFRPAPLLDALGWMGLSHEVRVKKAASYYLSKEDRVKSKSRTYDGPSKSTVGTVIKSLFTPPRGMASKTVEDTLREIERQRKIRDAREANAPFRFRAPRATPYGHRAWTKERMTDVAKSRYKTVTRNYKKELMLVKHDVVGMGQVADTLLIMDNGSHQSFARIYMKHKPTGREKVVVLDVTEVKSFEAGLMLIAPKVGVRAMFGGQVITFDYDAEGFLVDGSLVPWAHVCRVYTRKQDGLIRTVARPAKD